jgi:Icc-related predicted phosphoesterase
MQIIFLTDVHHAFRRLGQLLDLTAADLYLVAGDLVLRSFFRYQTTWRFMELQQILKGHRSEVQAGQSLQETAQGLLERGDGAQGYELAREYLRLCKQAEAYLQKSYQKLEGICLNRPDKNVYVLPGNYDLDLSHTDLEARNLHLKCIVAGDLRIAGYGGANVETPGIPDHLQVPFREQVTNQGLVSEAREFFRKTRPDVLVLHQPPYGHLDNLPGHGHAGSPGIRDYLDEAKVKIVASGHHHDHWGAEFVSGTWFFNPSNFGRTIEISQVRNGGSFLDLILDGKALKSALIRQLDKGKLWDVVDYRESSEGMDSVILDEERYARLGGKAPRFQHIRPVRQLQRIKSFFLGYETPESRILVSQLEEICQEIIDSGMEVAFDLLGSLSFGMAQADSDMDTVVYMRSKDCVLDPEDTCGVPRPVAAVFDALKARDLEVEVCDSLDLDRISKAIAEENSEDGQLQRFVFYRLVCRPVNRLLIKGVENLLLDKEDFRREVERGLKDYLDILVASVRHISSFEKYRARLRERGIAIAPDVEEAIRNYLRG